MFAVKNDPSHARHAVSYIGAIEIAATVFADLNNGMVILTRDLHHEVIDTTWPYLQPRFGQWALGRHLDMDLGEWVPAGRAPLSFDLGTEMATTARLGTPARVRYDTAGGVVKSDPIQRSLHDLFVARSISHRRIRRFANKRLRVFAMHRRVEKVEIIHGPITRGRSAISFAVGLGIGWRHAVSAPHSGS